MDIKHLVHVDDDGLEQWVPRDEGRRSRCPRRTSARCSRRCGSRLRGCRRRRTRSADFLAEVVDPNPRPAAVEVHKRRDAVHDRRLHGGADRRAHRAGVDAHDRDRVRGRRGACSRRSVTSGWRRGRTCSFARGLKALVGFGTERYAVIDVGTNSVKFHVGERRRTAAGGRSSTAPRSPASAKGSRRPAGSARSRWSARPRPSPAWPRRRGGTDVARDRGGRYGRAADRPQRRGARRRRAGALRRRDRGHLGRGGGRLAYLAAIAGLGPRTGPASCSTPAAAARSSPSGR